jgi:Na+/phosphate symporter
VETELETEFIEYEDKIRERTEEVRKALFRLEGEALTEEQASELRDMYTKIVKRLHPDLNPGVDQKDIETFYMAVNAYKDADLDKMRAIYWMVIDGQEAVIPEVDMKARIMEIRAEIEMIERSFPFDKREFLKDAEAVAERNRELDEMMDDYMEQIELVNGAISKLGVRP